MGMGKSAIFDIYKKNMRNFAGFLAFLFLVNLGFMGFGGERVSALYVPTLSASIGQTNLQVNGNQVINSTSKTTEIPLNLLVNTNNKTGYTATLNTETDETALVNAGPATNAKIESIDTDKALTSFSSNTWGVKFGNSAIFSPIPALSSPVQILQTTGKSNGNEINNLKIGMKLGDNLESGSYNNKLIFSILTNNYQHIAILTRGSEFNAKLKALGTNTDKIEHFKKSSTAPASAINAVNIDDEDSDYEIKLWLDSTDKTAYYYAEPEKVYLNKDSSWMFTYGWGEEKTKNIIGVDLSGFDTSRVTNMNYMFSNMSNLPTLNLSNFDTSQVTSMIGMFSSMSKLTSLDLSNFDTSRVTNMNYMFRSMSNLTSLDLSNFNTSKVTDMTAMFYDMSKLTSLNLSNFDTSNVTDMGSMFSSIRKLTSLNLSNFNTSKVTNMNTMFLGMSNLTSLNLSSFDTSRVTNMNYMFSGMSNLPTLNLSNFDTSQVTSMSYMFSDMSNLTSLNLSNFDTSQVTSMGGMFRNMSNLTSLDLSNFNTSKVTDMSYMFSNMSNLPTLNLSNFDTSQVTNMSYMFGYSYNLTELDLSSFDTSNTKTINSMFEIASYDMAKDKLEKIYVSNDFNTSKMTSYSRVFGNRKKLRGGNGSFLTDPNTADLSWLRIDRPGVQGYFTRKT